MLYDIKLDFGSESEQFDQILIPQNVWILSDSDPQHCAQVGSGSENNCFGKATGQRTKTQLPNFLTLPHWILRWRQARPSPSHSSGTHRGWQPAPGNDRPLHGWWCPGGPKRRLSNLPPPFSFSLFLSAIFF